MREEKNSLADADSSFLCTESGPFVLIRLNSIFFQLDYKMAFAQA